MADLRNLIQTSGSGLIFLLSYDGWHCVPHRDFQHLPRPKDFTEVLNAPYVHVSVDKKIDYEASFDSRLKLDGGKEIISQIIFVLSGMVERVETSYGFRLLGHSRFYSRTIPPVLALRLKDVSAKCSD